MVAPADWLRRGRRFFGTLWASADSSDISEAQELLGPRATVLFEGMCRADQWHALRVYRRVRTAGFADPDLLQAALLHDVGKSRAPLTVWHRVLVDLGQAYWPAALDWLERRGPAGLRLSLEVARRHPELGARAAEASGLSRRAVLLIRGDHDPSLAPLLALLRQFDSQE